VRRAQASKPMKYARILRCTASNKSAQALLHANQCLHQAIKTNASNLLKCWQIARKNARNRKNTIAVWLWTT